ncbi:PREDICTED: PERQ amino acid-rich with GYF domain-containing protein 2-like [Nicotiana attenuata]|uniref:PERQ amino acid-rich with GYF domain-containing protein 2-like n=1 Tax=Nicotiana attenuata TaxID=49451 RepID=UPI000904A4DA|nr:PREDICTED: PERQ amino acid-rich with GYF domain-containing protein 2-like [Nicotiana attenuata]
MAGYPINVGNVMSRIITIVGSEHDRNYPFPNFLTMYFRDLKFEKRPFDITVKAKAPFFWYSMHGDDNPKSKNFKGTTTASTGQSEELVVVVAPAQPASTSTDIPPGPSTSADPEIPSSRAYPTTSSKLSILTTTVEAQLAPPPPQVPQSIEDALKEILVNQKKIIDNQKVLADAVDSHSKADKLPLDLLLHDPAPEAYPQPEQSQRPPKRKRMIPRADDAVIKLADPPEASSSQPQDASQELVQVQAQVPAVEQHAIGNQFEVPAVEQHAIGNQFEVPEHRLAAIKMHEQLRAGAGAQSIREELERRDEELMRSIRRCSELEEQLHVKDEEIEVGKGVAAECEDLQAKVSSLRSELDKSATKVDALSAEWTEKVAELEKKVAEMERPENARVSALARVAALEDTIRVLRSERESERETTMLREARLEERIGELDRAASILGDRVAALEAKKAQLLAQAPPQESASTIIFLMMMRMLGERRWGRR